MFIATAKASTFEASDFTFQTSSDIKDSVILDLLGTTTGLVKINGFKLLDSKFGYSSTASSANDLINIEGTLNSVEIKDWEVSNTKFHDKYRIVDFAATKETTDFTI